MSLTFFLVGGIIFALYMYFTIWNIYNNGPSKNTNTDEMNKVDDIDSDGMGNFSRFPTEQKRMEGFGGIKLKKYMKTKKKEKM